MEKTQGRERVEEEVIAPKEEVCNTERVLRTMNLLERGARQAFLDGELSIEDTKDILGRVEEVKKRCEAGDIAVCSALGEVWKG